MRLDSGHRSYSPASGGAPNADVESMRSRENGGVKLSPDSSVSSFIAARRTSNKEGPSFDKC